MAIEAKTKRIEIIKQTTLPEQPDGDNIGRIGDIVDVPSNDATYLVGVKHAQLAAKDAKLVRYGKPAPAKAAKEKAKE